MEITLHPEADKATLKRFKEFEVLQGTDKQGNQFTIYSDGKKFERQNARE